MSTSNNKQTIANTINKIMGVKNTTNNQFTSQKNSENILDIQAVLAYILGTIFQIVIMIVALFGMEKVVELIDTSAFLPNWTSTAIVTLFFILLSIRSRIFSPLDNTRSRQTYDTTIRPSWAPPPIAFPIIWMLIAVLRVISSLLVWQQMNHNLFVVPLVIFVIHLSSGDTWNTIFTVERRLGAAVPIVIFGPWLSALIVTLIYWQTIAIAGIILAPSCIWLTIAALLVFRIWQLNGSEPLYPLKIQTPE